MIGFDHCFVFAAVPAVAVAAIVVVVAWFVTEVAAAAVAVVVFVIACVVLGLVRLVDPSLVPESLRAH